MENKQPVLSHEALYKFEPYLLSTAGITGKKNPLARFSVRSSAALAVKNANYSYNGKTLKTKLQFSLNMYKNHYISFIFYAGKIYFHTYS